MRSRGCLLLAAFAGIGCVDQPVPRAGRDLPRAPVDILVDDGGVPHIFGEDDRDVFFGAGYSMATDRLFQMDMARRRAHGRWAEVLGPDRVGDDKLARLFAWARLGREAAVSTARDNPEEWDIMTAWVAGVNARIDDVLAGKVPLPYGFGKAELDYLPERWEDSDPLVVARMTGFGNDLSIDFEIFATIAKNLEPEAFEAVELPRPARDVFSIPPEDNPAHPAAKYAPGPPPRQRAAPIGPPSAGQLEDAARALGALRRLQRLKVVGSNNWAIDGRFTASGRPLVAGDPHLGFDFPGVFYAQHMNSKDAGGSFDVVGFSFPGTPGISLGHTDRVAWTATTAFGDVMDIWDARLSEAGDAITLAGEPHPVVSRTETVAVRDLEPETFTFSDVPGIGVLLPDDIAPIPVASPGRALLLRWPGFETSEPSHLLGLDRATTIDEFEQAVDLQAGLNFNLVSADAKGISLRLGIDLPVRDVAAGGPPWMVLDGDEPAAQWTGEFLPRELLPRGRAEKRGWIQTANNDPYGFTANGRLDDDPWYYGAFFDPGWRAGRAADRLTQLAARGQVTLEDMQALQTDVHDNLADDLLPLLAEAWSHVGSDPALSAYAGRADLAALIDLLTTWDGDMTRSSAGAVAFHALSHFCVVEVLEDDFGPLFYPAFDLEAVFMLKLADLLIGAKYPNGALLLQKGRDLTLLGALDRTAKLLAERFGGVEPTRYHYSDLKLSAFRDGLGTGLDFGEAPTDGGEATVNVSPSTFFEGDAVAPHWVSHQGPIIRMVTTFAEDGTPELYYDFPLGNVADPASQHMTDMTPLWIEGQYRRMPFSRAEVEASSERHIVLPAAE